MRTVRLSAVLMTLSVVAASCGGDDDSTDTTTPVTTTTVADTTTTSSTTSTTTTTVAPTTSSTSTTSTAPPTTVAPTVPPTTSPPGAALVLREDGLGDARFDAAAGGVIAYVSTFVGAPTTDSGWVDPLTFGVCPGAALRIVAWSDLNLFFTSNDVQGADGGQFFFYQYGPPFNPQRIEPFGLRTAGGITVGDTVAKLRAAHPSGTLEPGDEFSGPTYSIVPGLFVYLSDASDAGVVDEFVGGFGCGE
jgi:hypothetical protein